MTDDRVRPSRLRAEQDRAIGAYLGHQVAPYSPFYRRRFAEAGLDVGDIRATADLAKLPLTSLAEIDDPVSLVLRPEPEQVLAKGEFGLRWTMRAASLFGRGPATARSRIDPLYKPLHWTLAGETGDTGDRLPLGYAAPDLDRLAELGRRWLEQAGLRSTDILVSVLPPGPDVAFWQLQLGARRGGVSALLLDSMPEPAALRRLWPTVLAGRPADLRQLLTACSEAGMGGLPGLETVLAVGEPLSDAAREELRHLAWGLAREAPVVVAAWAPPGARAVWSECRGGDAFHTWPNSEVVEIVEGEVVWTALGWRGSALVRLRTGVAATLTDDPCPNCGRTTPRLSIAGGDDVPPALVRVLDAEVRLAGWQAELRTVEGADELVVYVTLADGHDLAEMEPALRAIDEQLSVTQFVVLDKDEMKARLVGADWARVLDRRGEPDGSQLVHGR